MKIRRGMMCSLSGGRTRLLGARDGCRCVKMKVGSEPVAAVCQRLSYAQT